jgi:hypothetical protein
VIIVLKAVKHAKISTRLTMFVGVVHSAPLLPPRILCPLHASIPKANSRLFTVVTIVHLDAALLAEIWEPLQIILKGKL